MNHPAASYREYQILNRYLPDNLPAPPFSILRQAQDDKCHGELVEPFLPLAKGSKEVFSYNYVNPVMRTLIMYNSKL